MLGDAAGDHQRGFRDQARPYETSLFPGGWQRDWHLGLRPQQWFPGTQGRWARVRWGVTCYVCGGKKWKLDGGADGRGR